MELAEITENSQLECNGKPVVIRRYISNGASANVFAGEYDGQTVAVKAIRSSATGGYRSEFPREAQTMQTLWNDWAKRYPQQPQVVPVYFGGDLNGEHPFIVEEFIDGKNIAQAIRDLPGGIFSESQALQVAAQIGRMLVVLHEDMNTCYGDIKFKNFMIVGDPASEKPQLKVIDWNILSSYKHENAARELLYISTYLVFMLTNISLPVNDEQNSVTLDTTTSEAFKKLTYGTEQFLRTALNSDPTARFQTAREWLTGIEQLITYWSTDGDELVKSVSSTLSSIGLAKDYQSIYTAQKMLSIAKAKGAHSTEDLVAKLNEMLGIEALVGRIKHQLDSYNADMAARMYRNVINQPPYDTDERVVLWGSLAIAAESVENLSGVFNTLQRAVEERLAERWAAANQYFMSAGDILRSQGLNELADEAKIQYLVQNANDQEIEARLSTLQQASDLYQSLSDPLKKMVRARYDLLQKVKDAQTEFNSFQHALQLSTQASREPNVEVALELWENALASISSTNPDILTPLHGQVITYLEHGQYEEAERLASLPRKHGKNDLWCELAVKAARELYAIQVNIARIGPRQQIVQEIHQYEERSKQIPEKERNELFLSQGFQSLIEGVFNSALSANLFTVAEPMRQMALRLGLKNSSIIDRKYIEGWQKFCKSLYKQVEDRLNHQPLNDEDFVFIDQMLYGLPDDDLGELSADIRNLQDQVQEQRLFYNTQKERQAEEEKRKKAKIDELVARMQQAKDNYEKLELAARLAPVEAAPALRPEMTRQLFTYIAALLSWKQLERNRQENPGLDAWASQRVNEADPTLLDTFVKTQYPDAKEALCAGLEAALREGREQDVNDFLAGVKDDAYIQERQKLKQIQDFLAWSNALDEGRDDPTDWLAKDITPVYWQRGACNYFEKKVEDLLADFRLDNLAILAQSRLIARRLCSGLSVTPQPSGSWESVVVAAQALDKFQNTRKVPTPRQAKSGAWKPRKAAKRDREAEADQQINPQDDAQALTDELLNRIDNLSGWEAISPQLVKTLQTETTTRGRGWIVSTFVFGGAALALAAVLGLTLAGIPVFKPGTAEPFPPTAQIVDKVTPEPPIDPTPVPTATDTPVPTPTDIPTPVPTDIPTPVPTSAYALSELSYPYQDQALLPAGIVEPMYLIDDAQGTFSGDYWKTIAAGINASMRYAAGYVKDNPEVKGEWKLDQPLNIDGLYEIYIFDPNTYSGTQYPIHYQVFSDGTEMISLRGNQELKLKRGDDGSWRSIGIYDLKAGQIISVSLTTPENMMMEGDIVAADAVLIASLASYDMQSGPAKDLDQKGSRILFVADDSDSNQISFSPALDKGWEEKENYSPDGSIANVWAGKFHQINVTKETGEVSVTWTFAHPLPAGDYDLQIFIPQEMTVAAKFEITLDGKPLTSLETVALTQGAGAQGSHFPPEPWKISVPEDSKGKLVIKMIVEKASEGVFACDAAVLSVLK